MDTVLINPHPANPSMPYQSIHVLHQSIDAALIHNPHPTNPSMPFQSIHALHQSIDAVLINPGPKPIRALNQSIRALPIHRP